MALPVGQSLHLPRRGDGTIWTPDRAVESYNLYATDSRSRGVIPFQVNWPSPPEVTSEQVVSTNEELTASINTNGRRTIVQSGSHLTWTGGQINGRSDIDLVVQPGASIANSTPTFGMYWNGCSRVRVSGGGSLLMNLAWSGISDLMVDGVTYNADFAGAANVSYDGCARVAIINSTIRSTHYALFPGAAQPGQQCQDMIFANTQFIAALDGTQSIWRTVDTTRRLVFVDCRSSCESGGTYSLRIHGDAQDVWIRNCQFENGGVWFAPEYIGFENTHNIVNASLYDSSLYQAFGQGLNMTFQLHSDNEPGGYPRQTNLAVSGNEQYTENGGPFGTVQPPQSTWNFAATSYAGPSADVNYVGPRSNPPAWSFR